MTLYHGDCVRVLRQLPDAHVSAVVTDPPYGLEFMGQDWDAPWKHGFAVTGYRDGDRLPRPVVGSIRNPICRTCRRHQRGADRRTCPDPDVDERPADGTVAFGAWCQAWAAECLRVLKPGGHLLAFGGTRTWHRLAVAVEDAGFELRNTIAWLYATGFPKSLDVAKAIDQAAGAKRATVRVASAASAYSGNAGNHRPWMDEAAALGYREVADTVAVTDAAQQWAGWGTALKPAFEPIVVARKPLSGTVAANVLAHGTGALHIDACRVAFAGAADEQESKDKDHHADFGTETGGNTGYGDYSMAARTNYDAAGRWPPNVVLDEAAAAELDRQSGVSRSRAGTPRVGAAGDGWGMTATGAEYDDEGGASRFFPVFRYQPKAPTGQRQRDSDGATHPTVKPVDLVRWLVRLVTPPGGLVLDPFVGSGTTAEACLIEGVRFLGVEREDGYLRLAVARLSKPIQLDILGVGVIHKPPAHPQPSRADDARTPGPPQ